jgi:anti-sigma factor RsiW
MPSCRSVRANLTAWIDGELSSRWEARVRRHLNGCEACVAEAENTRAAIESQRRWLGQAVALADFDPEPLRVRLRLAVAREPQPAPGWLWPLRPLALAGAAVAAAIALAVFIAGGPKAVLIPLGVEPPPPVVATETDLFKDYVLIQHLDALENFDTVESVPLDDDQTTHRG